MSAIGLAIGISFSRALSGVTRQITNAFKQRVSTDSGTFEEESCLNTTVQNLINLNLYNSASLIITPNAYKAGKIYAVKPTSGLGDLTFDRQSAQTRRNSENIIENLADNIPALDYPNIEGCPWWNISEQSTNLFFKSTEPVTQNITVIIGQTYTVSVGAGGSATLSNAGTGSATSTTPFTFVASSTTLTVTIVSSPIWCQVETLPYASPLIITQNSILTRVFAYSGFNNIGTLVNPSEGTFFFKFKTNSVVGSLDIARIQEFEGLYTLNDSHIIFSYQGDKIVSELQGPILQPNTTYKVAIRYDNNGVIMTVNGVDYTDSNVWTNLSVDYTELNLHSANVLRGDIHYYPMVLSNAKIDLLQQNF